MNFGEYQKGVIKNQYEVSKTQINKNSCQKPLHNEIKISQLKINRPIHTLSAHSYSFQFVLWSNVTGLIVCAF